MQISIAEGWRRIASRQRGALADLKKAQIVRRSRVWFERALGQSSGVEYHRLKSLLGALDEFKRDPLLEPAKKRWFVLFRSTDPNHWNRSVNKGVDAFAVPLESAPEGLHYLRLRIVDGGKCLIIRMKKSYLGKDIRIWNHGWNGTCGFRSGAYHLGIYNTRRLLRKSAFEIAVTEQALTPDEKKLLLH